MVKHNSDGTEEDAYYGYNPHTDVEVLTDENGNTRATYGYTAYGKQDEEEFTGVDKPDPQTPDQEPYNVYRFNAKRWDPTTGKIDMGFRDYDPGLNRFLTRDMYNGALADMNLTMDPWNMNRYAFAGGNPVTMVELDGHVIEVGDGAIYIANPKTGAGRLTGYKAHPEQNGRYDENANQISIDGGYLIKKFRREVREIIQNNGYIKGARIVANKLISSKEWNLKLRKEYKTIEEVEIDGRVFGKILRDGETLSAMSRLGNMLVGAVGNEFGISLEETKQVDGFLNPYLDMRHDPKKNFVDYVSATLGCGEMTFTGMDYKPCDADDIPDVEFGWYYGREKEQPYDGLMAP
nr:RHS repeat-associated core domain-containing protein [Melghirimyces profundicolus]